VGSDMCIRERVKLVLRAESGPVVVVVMLTPV
jgi:hypothetical protein